MQNHIQEIILYINHDLYQREKNNTANIVSLLTSTYDTSHCLSTLSCFPQMLNVFLAHKYEIGVRRKQVKQRILFAHTLARTFIFGTYSLGYYAVGVAGQVTVGFGMAIQRSEKMLLAIMAKKSLERHFPEKAKETDNESQKKPIRNHISAVQKHEIHDDSPICEDPFKKSEAVFEPKTILNIKGYKVITEDEKKRANIIAQMEEYLSLSISDRVLYLDNLTEVKEITAQDCKKDNLPSVLIGQRGIFARRNLKKNIFIGFYTGAYIADDDTKERYIKSIGHHNYYTYVFGFGSQPHPSVSGYGVGNRMTLVNSPTTYTGDLRKIARDLTTKLNLKVIYAKSGENPNPEILGNPESYDMVSYATISDIPRGSQMFIDYGSKYWSKKMEGYIEHTTAELAKAMHDYQRQLKTQHKSGYLRRSR